MNMQLLDKIDQTIDTETDALAADTVRLVNIKSVRSEPMPGAPFGEGARRVLDEVLRLGREYGFSGKEYGSGVISVSLKEGQPDLGIWLHGDVVPEGDDWIYPPYNATIYKGCVIGRGATDNKGQLISMLHLLDIFRRLNVSLNYNPAVYVGSCEETGMSDLNGIPGRADVPGFLHTATPPRLSLVPDCSFPVACAGKGGMTFEIVTKAPLRGLTLEAGHADAPGRAIALLDRTDCPDIPAITVKRGTKPPLTGETPPRHTAHPDPNGNMITLITKALLEHKLCSREDASALDYIRRASLSTNGSLFGIDKKTETCDETVCASVSLTTEADGRLRMNFRVRYPLGLTRDTMTENICRSAEENAFTAENIRFGIAPYDLGKDHPMVRLLAETANSVTGMNAEPYIMGGGTYAHCLPNAYGFGMDGCKVPEDFPKGRGGAHGKDELVCLARLQRAMKIYARVLLKLNETEW